MTTGLQQLVYLIQGFFFVDAPRPAIGYGRHGAQVVLREEVTRWMFSGMFGPESEGSDRLEGRMMDGKGQSVLSPVDLKDGSLKFTKIYEHRSDAVLYQFSKDVDGTWVGSWKGANVGTGTARAILTPVFQTFLLPVEAAELPKKKRKRA